MKVSHNAPLKNYNTFGIDSTARILCTIETVEDLKAFHRDVSMRDDKRLILGGGSNTLLAGDFDGVVLHMKISGKTINERSEDWLITAGAGENWADFVDWTLEKGYPGLENLSAIPGTVGASPIQNIGAYGMEVSERISHVTVFDPTSGSVFDIPNRACLFTYRSSVFKESSGSNFVIISVTFSLSKSWKAALKYEELITQSKNKGYSLESPEEISKLVKEIRRGKLPDPSLIGNAGSFFKNPILSGAKALAFVEKNVSAPYYVQPDKSIKIPAGWLIDEAGWKGKRVGRVGIYEKQALVLVNHGGASGQDVLSLSDAIRSDILFKFGVDLEPEPVVVGC